MAHILLKIQAIANFIGGRIWLLAALMLLSNAILIFSLDFYQTLDGPAHFYNAHLILTLLDGNSPIENWYQLNHEIVPNYTSYLLISTLNGLFSTAIANNLLVFLLASLPGILGLILFRKSVFKDSVWALFLFPMGFTSALQMGFFNFSLGVITLLLYLFFLFRKNLFRPANLFWNALFGFLLLYTHAYVFVIAMLLLAGTVIVRILKPSKTLTSLFQNGYLYGFGLSAVPAGLVFILFALNHPSFNEVYLTWTELIEQLVNFSAIVSHHSYFETPYTRAILLLVIGLMGFRLVKIYGLRMAELKKQDVAFLFIALLLLVFYFFTPDSVGYAGFLSRRHQWYFVFLLILFLATGKLSKPLKALLGIVLVYMHVQLLLVINQYQQPFQGLNKDFSKVETIIPDHAVIYPLDFSSAYEAGHASNILGSNRNIILLDNYEASMDYFPVIWNRSSMPSINVQNWCNEKAKHPGFPKVDSELQVVPTYMAYSNDEEDWEVLCPAVFQNAKVIFKSKHVLLFEPFD